MDKQHSQFFNCVSEASVALVVYVCVCLMLIVFCVGLTLQFVRLFSSQEPAVISDTSQTAPVVENDRPEPIDIERLKQIPLFGVLKLAPVVIVPTIVEEKVIETALELTLRGLFTSTNKLAGQAIITGEFDDKLYKVGETFESLPNVSLLEVFHDRVTLNNNGSIETLFLYSEDKPESLPVQESYDDSSLSSFFGDPVEYGLSDEEEWVQYDKEQGILP